MIYKRIIFLIIVFLIAYLPVKECFSERYYHFLTLNFNGSEYYYPIFNGKRQFRPPTIKKNGNNWIANFEKKRASKSLWETNGHFKIYD